MPVGKRAGALWPIYAPIVVPDTLVSDRRTTSHGFFQSGVPGSDGTGVFSRTSGMIATIAPICHGNLCNALHHCHLLGPRQCRRRPIFADGRHDQASHARPLEARFKLSDQRKRINQVNRQTTCRRHITRPSGIEFQRKLV